MSDDSLNALRAALLTNRQHRPTEPSSTSPTSTHTSISTRIDDIGDDVETGTKFHKRARLGASSAAASSISAWGTASVPANGDVSTVVSMATEPSVPSRSIPGPASESAAATVANGNAKIQNSSSHSQSATPSRRSSQRRVQSTDVETAGDQVFRRGAWLALLESRQLAPFGTAPLIACADTLANVQRDGAWKKAPRIAVFVHRITLTETDAIVVARDPTGQMMGTVHRSVLEDHPLLTAGAALDLKHVPVFAPDVRHRYLNIMPENIERVFLASAHPVNRAVAPLDDPLAAYAADVREDVARRRATEVANENATTTTTPARVAERDAAAERARALLMRSAASARRRQGGPRRGRERNDNADNDEMPTPVPRNPLRPTPALAAVAQTPSAAAAAVSVPPPTPYQAPRQAAVQRQPAPIQQQPQQQQQQQQSGAQQQSQARSSLTAFRPAAIVSSMTQSTQQQVVSQSTQAASSSSAGGWPSAWPAPPTAANASAMPMRPPSRLTRFDELDDSAFLNLDV
jgi:hypothetical protein